MVLSMRYILGRIYKRGSGGSGEAHRKLPNARVGEGERLARVEGGGGGGGSKKNKEYLCCVVCCSCCCCFATPPSEPNPRSLRSLSGLRLSQSNRRGTVSRRRGEEPRLEIIASAFHFFIYYDFKLSLLGFFETRKLSKYTVH